MISREEVTKKLWQICDDFMINSWFFENLAPGYDAQVDDGM